MVGNLFSQDELNLKDKTWSAQIGFGTRRNLNIFEISKDFKINDMSSFYLTVGGPLSSIGAGYSFSNNYNENGLCFSASIGQSLLHYDSEQSDVEKDDLPSLVEKCYTKDRIENYIVNINENNMLEILAVYKLELL